MKNSLEKYHKKRDFTKTKEPKGKVLKTKNFRFVIQKHDATRLHYDFRIEHNGVLVSWAVPKGLPYKSSEKHLAMHVEDHPLHYFDFEGIIPEGNYGAGSVIVWDSGNYWVPNASDAKDVEKMISEGYEKGEIKLVLNGRKVKGLFALVRFKKAGENAWLFIKDKDEFDGKDFTKKEKSVKTGKSLKDIEQKQKESSLKFTKPMLATLGEKAFDDKDYFFEEKLDGYRTIAVCDRESVELFSRKGESMNKKFSSIVDSLKKLKIIGIFDGEIVAYDEDGKASFQSIQNANNDTEIKYHIFDILNLNGVPTIDLPLLQRKKYLKKAIPKNKKDILVTKFIKEKGKDLFKKTLESSEGVMAKKIDSKYIPGERTSDWIKIKNQMRQEFVIGGITKPKGGREGFGSLLVGYYKGKKLIYAGHIGTGFNDELISALMKSFKKIKRNDSPFADFEGEKPLQFFVDPLIIIEVSFAGWTNDKMIRQGSFVGIRTDKLPKEAVKESPHSLKSKLDFEGIISNPEKIYFPQKKYTKNDLATYYLQIAPTLIQYLKDRPQNLNRQPNGIKGENFFQKDIEFELPDYIETFDIKRDKAKQQKDELDKEITYILCQNKETLLYLVNLGCIEINPWLSRVKSIEKPDFMLFDIDPSGVKFPQVIKVVKALYELLESIGIKPFVKTSGKRGIHLYTNLGAKYSYEESRNFAYAIAQIMESKFPDLISLERSPAKRKNKVYIDYLQNRQGQTTASVYSARPTEFASVSTPLKFEEINSKLDPMDFTIKNTLKRLDKVGDLWEGLLKSKVDLHKSLKLLSKLIEK